MESKVVIEVTVKGDGSFDVKMRGDEEGNKVGIERLIGILDIYFTNMIAKRGDDISANNSVN